MKYTIKLAILLTCTFGFSWAYALDGIEGVSGRFDAESRKYFLAIHDKASARHVEIDWDWSPDVAAKRINEDLIVLFQRDSGNAEANVFIGLCAVVDIRKGAVLFLDYVTTLYTSPNGYIVYIPKIGRRTSTADYQHHITIVDLKKIQSGAASKLLTWKQREKIIEAGTYDFSKPESSAVTEISAQKIGVDSQQKIFLLAPPVFISQPFAAGLLIGIGSRVDRIDKIGIVSFSEGVKDIRTQFFPTGNISPVLLYEAAHQPSDTNIQLEWNKETGFFFPKQVPHE